MFRHRVTFQDPVEAQDTSTGAVEVIDWEDTFANVPASIEFRLARESVIAAQPQSVLSITVIVRWRPGIHAKQRIVWQSLDGERVFGIAGRISDKSTNRSIVEIPVTELAN